MAGAELALAILPLLLSAAQHYQQCLTPFKRYRKFAVEASRYCKKLEIQRTIFHNECRCLLEDVIEHGAALGMLDSLEHEAWSSAQLDVDLGQKLGSSKEACLDTIRLIDEGLQDVDTEQQKFDSIIEQERPQKGVGCSQEKSWRTRVARKLSFSFSQSRLEHNVANLRSLNNDLRVLSDQSRNAASTLPRPLSTPPQDARKEIERYQIIGRASQQVYQALGKACTKHTEHRAHFSVKVEKASIDGSRGSQVMFNLAFTHVNLADSTDQNDLLWFVVDSITDYAYPLPPHRSKAGIDQSLEQSHKRQIDTASVAIPKKSLKRVRFDTPARNQIFTPSPCQYLMLNRMRKDLCDLLRHCYKHPSQAIEQVCVLETDHCKNMVYPSCSATRSQRSHAISLRRLIESVSKQKSHRGLPLGEGLHLAKTLAIAVLQYHATPWISTNWRSEDVYFFGMDEVDLTYGRSSLASPHLNAKVQSPNGQLSLASASPSLPLIRNHLLFSLGIVLLEIAHSSSLAALRRPSDLNYNGEDQYTEFFAARRLAKSEHTDMGPRYHKIVEKLVDCDFGCGNDLNDPQLQVAFYTNVICPLEDLEQRFRNFHLDPGVPNPTH